MVIEAFDVPLARLRDIGTRHSGALAESERVALQPLCDDEMVDLALMSAFMKFRAIGSLWAACDGDGEVFAGALCEAYRLEAEGLL